MQWVTNGFASMGQHLIAEGCIIGEPKPTEYCTVEYLKSLGLVGFYLPTND